MKIEILRAGKFSDSHGRPVEIGPDDLRRIVESYDPRSHEAPVVIGHPSDDAPAYGWVKRLEMQGDRILAELDQVAPEFLELVRQGRFKHRSASLYLPGHPNHPRAGDGMYLRHVGFLGAQPPAVKGLRPVQLADDGEAVADIVVPEQAVDMAEISRRPWSQISESDYEDADSFCSASLIDLNPPGEPKTKARCKLPVYEPDGSLNVNALRAAQAVLLGARGGVDAPADAKRRAARKLIRLMREADIEPAPRLKEVADMAENETADAVEARLRDLEAKSRELEAKARELAEKEASVLAREQELEAQRRNMRHDANLAFAEALAQQGRLTPPDVEVVTGVLDALESLPADLSDGDAVSKFREWLTRLPQKVDFREHATGEGAVRTDDPNEIARAAVAYQRQLAEQGIEMRIDEAVRRVVEGDR